MHLIISYFFRNVIYAYHFDITYFFYHFISCICVYFYFLIRFVFPTHVTIPTLRKKTVTEPNIIFVFFTIFTTFRVFFKIQEMYYRYEIAGPFHNPCLLQYAYGLTLPSVSFSGINFKIG